MVIKILLPILTVLIVLAFLDIHFSKKVQHNPPSKRLRPLIGLFLVRGIGIGIGITLLLIDLKVLL